MTVKKIFLLSLVFFLPVENISFSQVAILHSDISFKKNKIDLDISKLKETGINIVFFAVWVNPYRVRQNRYSEYTIEKIKLFKEFVRENSNDIQIVNNFSEIKDIISSGKIAAILSIEGGHSLEGNIDMLKKYYNLGVRVLTLAWNNTNEIGDATLGKRKYRGLSRFGKEVVKEMESMGMLVDVSHLSEDAFWDVMKLVKMPVIASHSNAYTVCMHPRNLKDAQIREIAKSGGVIGINFHSGHLSCKKDATVDDVVKHINYIKNLVGVDYISIGGDWTGGIKAPHNLKNPWELKNLKQELLRFDYTKEEIEKIFFGNILRVLTVISRL